MKRHTQAIIVWENQPSTTVDCAISVLNDSELIMIIMCDWFDPSPNVGKKKFIRDHNLVDVNYKKALTNMNLFILAEQSTSSILCTLSKYEGDKVDWWLLMDTSDVDLEDVKAELTCMKQKWKMMKMMKLITCIFIMGTYAYYMSCMVPILRSMMDKLFIDEKSKSLNDKVLNLREAPQTISGSRNDNSQPIDEVALYYEAVGGETKRRVYGLGSQASYYCGGNTNASKSSTSSFESQNQDELQNELATMKKKIEAQDNLIVDLKRTIEMLCNHIGMPPLHGTQNASNNQPEECEGTSDGDGDGGEDPRLL
ncbi:uncharacterized protein LOC120273223 [Dioscorea cayenensis subsp. rotundata]|uniref:Uncharacterized protein LOC120273223 n=1 Tax=Dioscorea cayennensis subsp. rotundata TaxID=55577 RepID=A0AB40C7L9_DIOCR|nr:uncharacterized protein LOC120273223 [Dioscorea cayenensis subsp. rotundata]